MGKWRFNVGDIIQVNYTGWNYSNYDTFFEPNKELKKFHSLFTKGSGLTQGKNYEIVGLGVHPDERTEMYVIMNEEKNQVFIWGIPPMWEDIQGRAVLIRKAVNYESLLEIEE